MLKSLTSRLVLLSAILSALPVLPFVVNDFVDHRSCVAAARTVAAGTTLDERLLERLRGIRSRDLPERSVRRPADIVGRRATKALRAHECISFDSIDSARVRLVVPASRVDGSDVPVGSRVDLVVSPSGGELENEGIVVENAVLVSTDADLVTFAITEEERENLAPLIGRSQLLMAAAGEVDVP